MKVKAKEKFKYFRGVAISDISKKDRRSLREGKVVDVSDDIFKKYKERDILESVKEIKDGNK